jgi:hypothetical protein
MQIEDFADQWAFVAQAIGMKAPTDEGNDARSDARGDRERGTR